MRRRVLPPLLAVLAGCATAPAPQPPIAWPDDSRTVQLQVLNRVTWGANRSCAADIAQLGTGAWLGEQLARAPAQLPPEIQARIDEMSISRRSLVDLASDFDSRRRALQKAGPDERKAERQALNQDLQALAREAQTRLLLRALYSPNQLEEQLTWFWMNHFNVFQFKGPLRALLADYEERAIRPHALGRFRDLLAATSRHPAMLIYLDNAQNRASHINENYARELMELHTLGVDGGYTQRDVEALARILTGWSLDLGSGELSRFYPRRHDFGSKEFLGETIAGTGAGELDKALDVLARHPATARFVSRKLALFFVADDPPPSLVANMAQTFLDTSGDIPSVLRTMFASPEFRASLGSKFKDPLHYALSALRLVLDERSLPDAQPVIGALARMGEPLYARPTPDGYPLVRADWASPGQLATRFEIARGIAYRAPARIWEEPLGALSRTTQETLARAASVQEWNLLLLSSPEFMVR
jgi:uncharacterized protein (DUF1800 family)